MGGPEGDRARVRVNTCVRVGTCEVHLRLWMCLWLTGVCEGVLASSHEWGVCVVCVYFTHVRRLTRVTVCYLYLVHACV